MMINLSIINDLRSEDASQGSQPNSMSSSLNLNLFGPLKFVAAAIYPAAIID